MNNYVAELHKKVCEACGCQLFAYLDDWLARGDAWSRIADVFKVTEVVCSHLGTSINASKSCCVVA